MAAPQAQQPEPLAQKAVRRFNALSNSAVATANQTQDVAEVLNELLNENAALKIEVTRLNKALDEAAKMAKIEQKA